MTDEQREIFEQAFRSGDGGCCRTCDCGQVYYNSEGGWDWEEGELERLHESSAIDLVYTVCTLWLDGKEFCIDCDCWVPLAGRVFDWILHHRNNIAELLRMEKNRLQKVAESIPVID